MKKICFVFTLALSVLVSCTSKEDKADALVKDRGFDCPHIEKLEEFNCNPASSVLMMTAYNSLWQNDSLMRNMDLSSNNINYVYGKIVNQEANAKGLLERADILSTSLALDFIASNLLDIVSCNEEKASLTFCLIS